MSFVTIGFSLLLAVGNGLLMYFGRDRISRVGGFVGTILALTSIAIWIFR